jgi:O-antigen/teichoic acid export membrane protein
MLFDGFSSIGLTCLRRELEFNKLFIYHLTGGLADFIVSVSIALAMKNVWALVFGKIVGSLAKMLMSYLIHPYRPRISIEWVKMRELFTYGRWILGTSILFFLLNQGGDILVGKLLGATMLGFYVMAMRIPNLIANEITNPIIAVTFPAYSKLQSHTSDLKRAYLKVLQVTAFIVLPMMGLIIVLASDFTRIVLGEKWMPIVPAMRVLAGWAAVFALISTTWPLFRGIGRPDLETKLKFASLILLGLLLFPLTSRWGMVGTAWAVFLNVMMISPVIFIKIMKILEFKARDILKMLILPLIAVSLMVALLTVAKTTVLREVHIISFVLLVVCGSAIYLGIMQVIDLMTNYGMRAIVMDHIVTMRKKL